VPIAAAALVVAALMFGGVAIGHWGWGSSDGGGGHHARLVQPFDSGGPMMGGPQSGLRRGGGPGATLRNDLRRFCNNKGSGRPFCDALKNRQGGGSGGTTPSKPSSPSTTPPSTTVPSTSS
jgi:hypothetical protein